MADGWLLILLIFVAAVTYSSVGHAGASGYLAALALLGVAPPVMKPAALALNIFVASIAAVRFYRAGCFSWPLFWPFAVGSIPMAFVGGATHLPGRAFKIIVAVVLLIAAARLVLSIRPRVDEPKLPPRGVAIGWGAGMGFLAGLTGTGGGIFLTPLVLLMNWATPRTAAGVSAVFILLNSISGLLGNLPSLRNLPPMFPWWAVAACAGGVIGSELGSRRLPPMALRRLLGLVLIVAALKLMLT
jgi:uncharacterized membrane protein YfcA